MKRRWLFWLPLLLAGAGCVDVDYVGQRFEPPPEEEPIRIFGERETPPPGEYQTIGRLTLTAPENYTRIDLEDKLLDVARENGGDAVRIVSFEKRLLGAYYRQPRTDAAFAGNRTATTMADGTPVSINSFGEEVSLEGGSYKDRYEVELKALLLMAKPRYLELRQEREELKAERLRRETAEHVPEAEAPAPTEP